MRRVSRAVVRIVELGWLICICVSQPAFAETPAGSFTDVAVQLRQGDLDIASAYRPGEAIVKYRDRGTHAVRGDVQALLREGGRFQRITASGSDSLDRLHGRHRVAAATRVFHTPHGRKTGRGRSRSSAHAAASDALSHIYKLQVPATTDLIRMCEAFKADPSIEYCHPNYRFETYHIPNDRYFDSTGAWGQDYADLWGLAKIGAHAAWHEIGTDPSPVIVAVVDTGIDYNHPDIADNVWHNDGELSSGQFIPGDINSDGCPGICGVDDDSDGLVDEDSSGCGAGGLDASGVACSYLDDLDSDDDENGFADDHIGWDFAFDDNDPIDDVGHGTHVAGTIAATIDNAIGVVGVAPNAQIMIVKGLGPNGGSTSDLVAALKYAVDQGADVINNSWGNPIAAPAPEVLIDAIAYATANGVVVVSAAGNSAAKLGGLSRGHAPASIPDSIAVSAFDQFDLRSDFSNFGVGIDVAAPGGGSRNDTRDSNADYVNILSLRAEGLFESSVFQVGDDYVRFRGTSMASPHVAGVAALILSAFPQYTVEEVRQVLKLSADDTGVPGWDLDSGSGRVNAHASVVFGEPCSALIRLPVTSEIFSGTVDIRGVASGHSAIGGTNFAGYRVEYAAGGQPDATDWMPIATSTAPVAGTESDSLLAHWIIPATLPDGEYSLRLVVVDDLDREYESRVQIEVDGFDPPEMSGWPQLPPHGLTQLIPMIPVVGDLDGDGDLEILLGPYAWHHDGTSIVNHPLGFFTDYPFSPSLFQGFHGAPSIGDIDGDAENEVVLIYSDAFAGGGAIHVFGQDGQSMPGWPKALRFPGSIGRTATPVLADIDDDGALDVIVLDSDGLSRSPCQLDVYRGDGSLIFSRAFAHACLTIPTVADLDGDAHAEIILLGSTGQISVVDHTGQPAPIWPQNFRVNNFFEYTAPSVGDLDGDGELDIVVPSTDAVYAFASNGLALEGWPIRVACCDASIAALADLDRDGALEVVIGDRAGSIHVLDHRGVALDGWPIVLDGPANTTAALADIDGDGALDIVAVTGDRKVHAWNIAGHELATQGWPIATGEYAADSPVQDLLGLAAPPIVADLDSDGDREVVAFTRNVHVWDLPDAAAELPREWRMYRSNPRGTGNVDEDRVAQPPADPRIYVVPENFNVADIESFSLSFDLASPVAPIARAQWAMLDADDPDRKKIIGWLDGQEVDLAKPQPLPAAIGLVSQTIRLPEPGRYRVHASIQTEPAPDTDEDNKNNNTKNKKKKSTKRHQVFTTDIINVIEVLPANPVTRIVPGPSAFARTTVAARVDFDLIEGLRLLVFTVKKAGQSDEPVLGSVKFLELGEVNAVGERDLSERSLIGLFLAAASPTFAKFSVNEVGEYDVEISILAYPQQLSRTIEVGSARARFTATPIPDTDADGWFDIQDNCPWVDNGVDQAPTSGCAAPPCVGNQIDTDGDGYGNACDGDLNGDGEITGMPGGDCTGVDSDWCLLEASLGTTIGGPGYEPDADCNGDARIDAIDQMCMVDQSGGPVGPSGLDCAGTYPCFKSVGDADNDGLANGEDGCVFVRDALQRDGDEDGFGNACDADYDNDGIVGFGDFSRFATAFRSTDEVFDHDGDGFVGFPDFGFLVAHFGRPPGPSGRDVLPFVDPISGAP